MLHGYKVMTRSLESRLREQIAPLAGEIDIWIRKSIRVYPKVSGLSYNEIKINSNNKLVEKQDKGLWRQNSLD